MASAIAQHLDQFQAESNQSNDFHRRRATVDYIPKAHSKLPFNYAAVAWEVIDSPEWVDRKWQRVPAKLINDGVRASIPENATGCFLAIEDQRGAYVNTPYLDLSVG